MHQCSTGPGASMAHQHPQVRGFNVPHAFVPHADIMSPTAAPWQVPQTSEQALGLRKPPPEVINASASMPAPAPSGAAQYAPAQKRITTSEHLKAFLESPSARSYVSFVLALNDSATGKKLSVLAQAPCCPAVQRMGDLLQTLGAWVDEIPPVEQSLRYGNPSFRTWSTRLREQAEGLLTAVLPDEHKGAAVELVPYLLDSFGNPTRIDYGTGHETTFVALLYCMAKLGVFGQQDCAGLVGVVFSKYLALMRKVQTTYW